MYSEHGVVCSDYYYGSGKNPSGRGKGSSAYIKYYIYAFLDKNVCVHCTSKMPNCVLLFCTHKADRRTHENAGGTRRIDLFIHFYFWSENAVCASRKRENRKRANIRCTVFYDKADFEFFVALTDPSQKISKQQSLSISPLKCDMSPTRIAVEELPFLTLSIITIKLNQTKKVVIHSTQDAESSIGSHLRCILHFSILHDFTLHPALLNTRINVI